MTASPEEAVLLAGGGGTTSTQLLVPRNTKNMYGSLHQGRSPLAAIVFKTKEPNPKATTRTYTPPVFVHQPEISTGYDVDTSAPCPSVLSGVWSDPPPRPGGLLRAPHFGFLCLASSEPCCLLSPRTQPRTQTAIAPAAHRWAVSRGSHRELGAGHAAARPRPAMAAGCVRAGRMTRAGARAGALPPLAGRR